MLFGLSGVELSLIIVFFCLFGSILSGYPVAFAISGSAVVSFFIIAVLSANGLLYELETINGEVHKVPVLAEGWQKALLSTLSTWSQGVFSRAFGGNVETLLAVPMFVLMGIALERSRIAEDLLITMAKLFGTLPGGLAIAVVFVGTLLAASTGIVGATVVTMGLISLPTMLRHGYSKALSTGVIATSGTLGQIIPPSIVIVLLGSIVGDMYAIGQENRAKELGVTVLEMLGEPAVLSTGTLFKAAFIPGLVLACLYAAYAFIFALMRPNEAPPVNLAGDNEYRLSDYYGGSDAAMVGAVIGPPIALALLWTLFANTGIVGEQAAISRGVMAVITLVGVILFLAMALRPNYSRNPLLVGLGGLAALAVADALFASPGTSGGFRFLIYLLPAIAIIYGLRVAIARLMEVESIRVVSPPVILIVAVLGSILGGGHKPDCGGGTWCRGSDHAGGSAPFVGSGGERQPNHLGRVGDRLAAVAAGQLRSSDDA